MIINVRGGSYGGAHPCYIPIQAGLEDLKQKNQCLKSCCDWVKPDPLLVFEKKVVVLLAHNLGDVDVSFLASKNLSFHGAE